MDYATNQKKADFNLTYNGPMAILVDSHTPSLEPFIPTIERRSGHDRRSTERLELNQGRRSTDE